MTYLLESPKKETGAQDTGTPVAVVKLLHATRLPTRQSKLIQVEIADDKRVAGETTLFEPEVDPQLERTCYGRCSGGVW